MYKIICLIGKSGSGKSTIEQKLCSDLEINQVVSHTTRPPRKKELEGLAEFCPLEKLLAESDILSIHIASSKETFHFIDSEKLAKMKKNAILINTSRGPIVDSQALIQALESGHIGGAGLDVFDGDRNIYYRDFKNKMVSSHEMAILNSMPNVLMLPHFAYFTDHALQDMVSNSLKRVFEELS